MREKISVAMATYNGERYIKEQIESILKNLQENDELIISDDGSTDNTTSIIKSFKDDRIKLYDGPKKGLNLNFDNAIRHTSGKYIFLADQDDIWSENKVETILNIFKNNKTSLVMHDAIVFNDMTKEVIYDSFFKYRNSGKGVIKNIWKDTYMSCCMAFDSKLKKIVLPIPRDIETPDQWIGILNDIYNKDSILINEKLIKYRRHQHNTTTMRHYKLPKMIKKRIVLIHRLLERIFMIERTNNHGKKEKI